MQEKTGLEGVCPRDLQFAAYAAVIWEQDLPWDFNPGIAPELFNSEAPLRGSGSFLRHDREHLDESRLARGKNWVKYGNVLV